MSSRGLATFSLVDYFVFLVMIVGSLSIGIYYGIRSNKTTEEFLMAGRSMSPFPVVLSLVATYISSISILGEYTVNRRTLAAYLEYSAYVISLRYKTGHLSHAVSVQTWNSATESVDKRMHWPAIQPVPWRVKLQAENNDMSMILSI